MSSAYIHRRYLSSSKRGLDVCVSGEIKNFYTWNISNRENEHARCVAYVPGLIWSRFGFIYDHTRLIMYNIIVFLDFPPTVGENVAEFVWKFPDVLKILRHQTDIYPLRCVILLHVFIWSICVILIMSFQKFWNIFDTDVQ